MRAALRFHFVFSAWLIVGRNCCACLGTVLRGAPFSALIEFLCAGDRWDAGDAEPDGITQRGLSSPAPAALYSSADISGITITTDIIKYINFPVKVRAALFLGERNCGSLND